MLYNPAEGCPVRSEVVPLALIQFSFSAVPTGQEGCSALRRYQIELEGLTTEGELTKLLTDGSAVLIFSSFG
jgi:hypothetical protein